MYLLKHDLFTLIFIPKPLYWPQGGHAVVLAKKTRITEKATDLPQVIVKLYYMIFCIEYTSPMGRIDLAFLVVIKDAYFRDIFKSKLSRIVL